MLTKRRALATLAGLLFAGFCLGGWLFLRSLYDADGAAASWSYFEVTGRTVTVTYQGDTCESERSIEVHVTSDAVVLTVRVEGRPGMPFISGCVEDAETFTVELDAPVGDRLVLDGACMQDPTRDECVRRPAGQWLVGAYRDVTECPTEATSTVIPQQAGS